jgi:hypothetical protein
VQSRNALHQPSNWNAEGRVRNAKIDAILYCAPADSAFIQIKSGQSGRQIRDNKTLNGGPLVISNVST